MKIQVTQDDIDNGIRDDCEFCPVALAVKRHNPDTTIYVYPWDIQIGNSKFSPSLAVCLFINRFDGSRSVEPFEFKLPDKL